MKRKILLALSALAVMGLCGRPVTAFASEPQAQTEEAADSLIKETRPTPKIIVITPKPGATIVPGVPRVTVIPVIPRVTTAPEATPKVTPAPAATPQGTPAATTAPSDYAQQVVDLVNAERAKAGVSPLTVDSQAATAAQVRAKEISSSFSHTRPDGRNFSSALNDQGLTYKGSGENIAWGQKTPEAVVKTWMSSPGHRANILNPSFTKIGVGNYQDQGTNYWTQLFAY